MASKAQSGRLDYLYQASHAVFATCPSLSRFYMSEFQQCLEQQGTAATKLIARSACPKCGQIYAPGLNCTVDLEPLCKKRRRSKKKNRLVYECGACHHKYYLQGSQPAYVKSTKMDDEDTRQSIPASSSAITTTTTTTISKKTPSGSPVAPIAAAYTPSPVSRAGAGLQDNKKKKKPKKNSLQAMLANRKQNEKQASSSSGLGLDDFLSSL